MVLSSRRSKRTVSGGRYIKDRKKRKSERRNNPVLTKIGQKVARVKRLMGGSNKTILLSVDSANVYDPKKKSYKKVQIKSILENEANRHFVRRNILTKGAVIETELGKAKVTSRPGQEGTVNAVLIE